jgi:putative membrane protein
MRFLSTLFWVLLAIIVVLFATRNWMPVPLRLWDDIEADVNLPLLLFVTFLLGFLPTWLVMRARIWSFRRRLEAIERQKVTSPAELAETDAEAPAA